MRIEVGGWVCTSLARVVRMGTASCPLTKVAPIYDSAEEAMALPMILETLYMAPLRVGLVAGG